MTSAVPPPPRRLGTAEEVPAYQRRPFIRRYYRRERPQWRHFCSCHNELGNIWTHLLAYIYTLLRFITWFASQEVIISMTFPRSLYAVSVVVYFVTALTVFGASVQFHWRMCAAKPEFLCWRCLDQSCCLALVVVGFFSGIPMGFHCTPWLQKAYLTQAVLVMAIVILIVWTTPKENAWLISISIIVGTLTALVPAFHWLVISEEGRKAGGTSLALAVVFGMLAIAAFCSNVPERLAPGRFDLLGSSHQLWHIFIFLSIISYGDSLTTVFELTGSPKFCA